jgi:hypothetical protein
VLRALQEFLFPFFCAICQKKCERDAPLCTDCYAEVRWFSSAGACKRCSKTIDVDERLCLNCRRGYFFAERVTICLEHPPLHHPSLLRTLIPFYCHAMILYFLEHEPLEDIDAIDAATPALDGGRSLYQLSTQLGVPLYRSWELIHHLLLISFYPLTDREYNQITRERLFRGVKKVSFAIAARYVPYLS